MTAKYLSVCSGIEAASVAWHPLGWEPLAFAEIDKFPSAVLAHHWPDVPNLGDMTKYHEWRIPNPDILVGGTPCQSFSVAGLRKGLRDPRGNLALTFLGMVEKFGPRFVVWENVPGVLSSNGGRDFASFVFGLEKLGYEWAYRVLDAKYYGVPQRRRRVFVVGCPRGSGIHPGQILFEPESLRGDSAPSRESGEEVAGTLGARTTSGGGFGGDFEVSGGLQPVVPPLNGGGQVAVAFDTTQITSKANRSSPQKGDPCYTLAAGAHPPALVFSDTSGALRARAPGTIENSSTTAVMTGMQVRRLTPRECERLQGFPDDHTLIPYNGKPAKDGPRYKALGNSMAVPVMRWIGERIQRAARTGSRDPIISESSDSVTPRMNST